MALWFPLMVNSTQIGEVAIVRRDEPMTDAGEYTYDWTIGEFQCGTTKRRPTVYSGELTHAYDDGALSLVAKVLRQHFVQLMLAEPLNLKEVACPETSDARPAESIAASARRITSARAE
ncbi:hypothetical protein [Mycobacterium sp. IS-836]|uniref:hypothetical protein n=1 Tax=Mycobacterium sp. IS-836 TaxID=1834160 RepID=UPI001300EBE2|nr:hypothetical protein [Mycobacterium sp. IS-836]